MTNTENYKLLSDLEESGALKKLVVSGFCSPCLIRNLELCRFIDARVRTGTGKTKAVEEAETVFKVCRKQVFKILKTFK